MQRDLGSVVDIVLACRDILDFTRGMTELQFQGSELVRSAVVRKIEVVGEAAKRVSDAFRADHAGVPWLAMAGMRDRLIHGYDQVDWQRVWETVEIHVPELLAYLEPLVPPDPHTAR